MGLDLPNLDNPFRVKRSSRDLFPRVLPWAGIGEHLSVFCFRTPHNSVSQGNALSEREAGLDQDYN